MTPQFRFLKLLFHFPYYSHTCGGVRNKTKGNDTVYIFKKEDTEEI